MNLRILQYNRFLESGGTPVTKLNPAEQVLDESAKMVNSYYSNRAEKSSRSVLDRILKYTNNNDSNVNYLT